MKETPLASDVRIRVLHVDLSTAEFSEPSVDPSFARTGAVVIEASRYSM